MSTVSQLDRLERHLTLLQDLAAGTTAPRTLEGACREAARALGTDPDDLPFALIYIVDTEKRFAALAGLSGLDRGTTLSPERIDLNSHGPWPFHDALLSRQPIVVSNLAAIAGVKEAVVLAATASRETQTVVVLVAGLNPLHAFDDAYRRFLGLVAAGISSATGRVTPALSSEAHHRVKNSLQIIVSLLNLQAGAVDDPRVISLFEESRNRIQSIALIHELLYRSGPPAAMDLAAYAGLLAAQLVRLHGVQGRVETQVIGEGARIDPERAVSCGLLLNELVSNALKHGFPERRTGAAQIEIGHHGENLVLRISDNGIGFPSDLDYRQSPSLGMKVISLLVRQLRGTIKMIPGPGTTFEVSLPRQK